VNPTGAGWVTVAVLGRTRGNRGEITALALSDKPERFQALGEVYLFRGEAERGERFEVENAWFHDNTLILKFRGIDTISDAERLSGAEVRVPMGERTPLEPGEFFQSDLVGCEVVDRRTGQSLGRVTGWEDNGGAGLLVVENDWLVPFARSICVAIEPAAGRIEVDLPEGLKDLNRS
jgi:16S rRNA processing protein RimM